MNATSVDEEFNPSVHVYEPHKVKSRSIHQYDATRTQEVVVTCPTRPMARSWGRPTWTEERREPGHGASQTGLRSAGSEATGATREGRESQPQDPPRRRRG